MTEPTDAGPARRLAGDHARRSMTHSICEDCQRDGQFWICDPTRPGCPIIAAPDAAS